MEVVVWADEFVADAAVVKLDCGLLVFGEGLGWGYCTLAIMLGMVLVGHVRAGEVGEHVGVVVGDAVARLASPIDVRKTQYIADGALCGEEDVNCLSGPNFRKQYLVEMMA